ncbi:MAG: Gfo/Idh/MocA family oxidoreductase [Planctomycetota bacterium]
MTTTTTAIKTLRFGVIGAGLMGREFASAAARWCHLLDQNVRPEIVAVCDPNPQAVAWFEQAVPTVTFTTDDYKQLIARDDVDAIYCAVPHHLHSQLYTDIIASGKHLLGEKPFGIDQPTNRQILETIAANPGVTVSCSSEMPFFPGAMRVADAVRSGSIGRILGVEAGFWHSSDLNPLKPINWKRRVATCGEYGCLGDLGMHVAHLPLRFGWKPRKISAVLSKVVKERPDGQGGSAPCETWDNATLFGRVQLPDQDFPLTLSTNRIAPGHGNTWFISVLGTEQSIAFSTNNPKALRTLDYTPGGPQSWATTDTPYASAYPAITGAIFEFGFSDAIQQMWAAFCDEAANGRDAMNQPLYCATPQEAADSHALFTAALESHQLDTAVEVAWN